MSPNLPECSGEWALVVAVAGMALAFLSLIGRGSFFRAAARMPLDDDANRAESGREATTGGYDEEPVA
ncbi:MAG: hypothetical protein L0Z55_10880 [Planctomycetes bacterium]|nr:hypothetical protein [Planctomycetota bacterium]